MKRRSPHSALLALTLIEGLGFHRLRKLLDVFGDANLVLESGAEDLLKVEGIGPVTAGHICSFNSWEKVDRILKQTDRCRCSLVGIHEAHYPSRLKQIYDAPALLWVRGSLEALSAPGIAVVGTRRPDHYGLRQAEAWSKEISRAGLSVISGLAYGIDTAAHRSALKRGSPTIAVLGSGIDMIYPRANRKLAVSIINDGGALLSEFPPGSRPEPGNFPRRNRVVSGLSLGVLMVQSGVRGGSMITARYALDQNREVFIIPHSLENPSGIGCNELIMRGEGKLVRSIGDLLEELPANTWKPAEGERRTSEKPPSRWKDAGLDDVSETICTTLARGPAHIDKLITEAGVASTDLLPALLGLEMTGLIKQKAGKYFELA